MTSQYKLAIIGNVSSILIYRALGTEGFAVNSAEAAREQLETLVALDQGDEAKTAQYAVIFVEEDLYREFPDDLIEKLTKKPLPAVIPVPSPQGSDDDFASKRLSKIVERAVGSDIMS
jgi:vacuolar-type H+-ATPase subunit F/Vma7